MRRLQIALVSGLAVALLAAVVVIIHQSRRLAKVRQSRDTVLQSLHETQEELRQSQLRLAAALSKPSEPVNNDKALIARRNATIVHLTRELSTAQANITQFQQELSAAKDENEQALASSSERYRKLRAELQNKLDALQKDLNSAQGNLQNSHQRIASLEKANAKLQAESSAGSTRVAQREHILTRLQDLDRQRESYLTSIANRYRNITSQFRNMSGMFDSSHQRGPTNAFSGATLDLIQNAISQSDNDLQHLSELNAKAFRLEKELSKK